MRRRAVAGAALLLVSGAVPLVSPLGAGLALAADGGAAPFDFDGDGFADLAVGVPNEGLGRKASAGAVQVLYGSASGVTSRDQLWHQGRPGVKGKVEPGDRFGYAVASGDFNGDGYAELAIGIPAERVAEKRPGAVQVLYGSPRGLSATGDQIWHQGSPGVPGANENGDAFGTNLAVGDFDGDGYADLVIGSPERVDGKSLVGRVVVLHGSASGLTADRAQGWGEWSAGIASEPRGGEHFGERLAAGDINGDGRDDLAISVRDRAPRLNESRWFRRGALHVLLGSSEGLTASGSAYFHLTDLGIDGSGDAQSLWLGDIDADGRDDLTMSVELVNSPNAIVVLHGHESGLQPAPLAAPQQPGADAVWWYGDASDDRRGVAPAVSGDLTGDGYADLAWLAQGQNNVNVVPGGKQGLVSDIVSWPVDRRPIWPALNVLPFSGGTHMWLAIGSAGDWENPPGSVSAGGAVLVLRGVSTGDAGPLTVWTQDSPGIKGRVEAFDEFGRTVGGTNY